MKWTAKTMSTEKYYREDALASVTEQALTLQESTAAALKELRAATAAIAVWPETVTRTTRSAIYETLDGAADQAREAMSDRLETALAATEEATDKLKELQRSLTLRGFAMIFGVVVVAIASLAVYMYVMGWTPTQMRDLRLEHEQLAENNARWTAKGTDTAIVTCRDQQDKLHLCVDVDVPKGATQAGYYVLRGH